MNATKKDDEKRYVFKEKLLRDIITNQGHSKATLGAVFYFIDFIIRLPDELSKRLRDEIQPILMKEGKEMVQFNSEDLSPTFPEIVKLRELKGREEGKEEAQKRIALEMLKEDIQIDFIAKVTHLDIEAIQKLKETI